MNKLHRRFAVACVIALTLASTSHADWRVNVQNEGAAPNGDIVGGSVDDINEGEALLSGGGAYEAAGLYSTLSFNNFAPPFPPGTATGISPWKRLGSSMSSADPLARLTWYRIPMMDSDCE